MAQEMFSYYNARQNVNVDNALASVLSNFDSDWVRITVAQALEYKFQPFGQHMPNIVFTIEQQMKLLLESFDRKDEVEHVRIATYREIIDQLCGYYNLAFNDIEQDYYSTAFYLYQLLVSDFTNLVFRFFVNYIIKEQDGLYQTIMTTIPDDVKKQKDSAVTYSSRLYSNNKIATLHAYIDTVLNIMLGFDVPFEHFINIATMDPNVTALITTRFADCGDFYKTHITPFVLNPATYPYVVTSIKLMLQESTQAYMDTGYQYKTKEE